MAYFIELHSKYDNDPLLVNIEAIEYVEREQDGSAIVHICGTRISSSSNGQYLNRVDGSMQIIYIQESYQEVKSKLSNYYDRF